MASGTQLSDRNHNLPRRAPRVRDSSPEIARSIAIVCRNLVSEPSEWLAIGRFELVRTLGRGGHGVVYEALDPRRGERVALKVLHGQGPSQLYRIKREFRALAELRHPNLVALHELSVGEGDACFTMELIDGCDFVSYARNAGGGDEAVRRLRDALAQLSEGVHALHTAGKLHRDLKPSNVLVTERGRVVLLDFGLAGEASHDAVVGGTRGYMAPEQARGEACAASDWYGVGRILEQALAALRQRLGRAELERAAGELNELEQLARRLVRDEPAERPGFTHILERVACGSTPRSLEPFGPAPASTGLVGRERAIERLREAFARSLTRPAFVLVRGEPGIGKSALIEAFARELEERSEAPVRVLRGRCHERESVPYKALDSTIDELSRALLALSPDHPARAPVPDGAALTTLFPVLGCVFGLVPQSAEPAPANPIEARTRAFAALRALLARLAAERPLVLFIDDLHWSDVDSGHLLRAVLCEEDTPPILVVASERTDARHDNPAIAALQREGKLTPRPVDVEEIALDALDPPASRALARTLLEETRDRWDGSRVDVISAEARGNPRLLVELARLSSRSGGPLSPDGRALTIDTIVSRKLDALSDTSSQVLQLVAVAGTPIAMRIVTAAAGWYAPCHGEVKALCQAGLLRTALRGGEEQLELEHPRVGEAVLGRITEEQRRSHSRALSHALEREPQPDHELLVDLYLAGAAPEQAAIAARRAADSALGGLAFARAARLYARALELGDWPLPERAALHTRHAAALNHSGAWLESAAAFQAAAERTDDPLAAALLRERAADQLTRHGRYVQGEALLREGYRALGLRWPASRAALWLGVAWLMMPRALRRPFQGAASVPLLRARAELLSNAGRGLELYDFLRATYNALLCFEQAEQIPDPSWRARARGARGLMRSLIPWPGCVDRGIAELRAACRDAATIGDVQTRGELESQLAAVYYFKDDLRKAYRAALSGEACLRVIRDARVDLHVIGGVLGTTLFDLGRVRQARRQWHVLSHVARLHGDLMTTIWVHANPAHLAVLFSTDERAQVSSILDSAGRLRAEHPRYAMIAWVHAAGSAERALRWGGPHEAVDIIRREKGVLFGQRFAVLRSRARMMRARACLRAASVLPRGERSALLRRATLDAALIRAMAPGAYSSGITRLISAAVAELAGKRARALAHLEEARASFAECEASLLELSARYCALTLACGHDVERAGILDSLASEGVVAPVGYIAWAAAGFGVLLGAEP